MQLTRLLLSLSMAFSFPIPAVPQQPPQRDPQALAALSNAITLMGGFAGLAQVKDCVAEGQFEQTENDLLVRGSFLWKNASNKFRYETTRDGQTQVFVSDGGSPEVRAGGSATSYFAHVSLFHSPPHLASLVLAERFQRPKSTLQFLGPALVQGKHAVQVLVREEADEMTQALSTQVWSFEIATGLPLQVEYRLADNADALRQVTAIDEFSDYRSISGVLVPFRIVSRIAEWAPKTFTLTSVAFNSGISPTEFDPSPESGQ